jgi:hypothetical protein
MTATTIPPSYPLTFALKADNWGSGVVVDVRAISGQTAAVSIGLNGDFFYCFERRHWDGLRAAFLAIEPLQQLHARKAPMDDVMAAAATAGVELRTPDWHAPRWLMSLMDWQEKWASIRVPCCYGAMYIGLAYGKRTIGLSRSWHGVALCRPTFTEPHRTKLIEHVVFAAEHAKTILETP